MDLQGKQKNNRKKTDTHCAGGEIFNIPPYLIRPNSFLSRTQFSDTSLYALSDSIRRYGILQPLGVCLSKDGKYELIAGERRLRAAVLLGLSTVPCVLVGKTGQDAEYLSVIENVQRESLNMFDEARAIKRLMERDKITVERASELLSISRGELARKLSLTRFSRAEMQEILHLGIPCDIAYILVDVPSSVRYYTVKLCAERGLSKQAVRNLVDAVLRMESPSPDDVEAYLSKAVSKDEARQQKKEEKKESKRKQKIVLHDLLCFERALEKSCDVLRRAGLSVTANKDEQDGETTYTLKIKKQ